MLFEKYRLVDLTHSLTPNVPTWDNSKGFHVEIGSNNDQIIMNTSTGTHMDAPSYLGAKQPSIDAIPLEQLFVACCVIDVSKKANQDYIISPQDIENYEKNYGAIKENSLVIGYTGWSRFWTDPKAYRNADANGDMHFPIFSMEAIDFLLTKKIAGIGTDAFAPESLASFNTTYPIHQKLFNEGKYIIENMHNVSLLPPQGSYVLALPLKVKDGAEAPARVIALVPKK